MKRLIIIGIVFTLFACASLPTSITEKASNITLPGRSGSSTAGDTSTITTLPQSGNLIIFGVAGRQSTREGEVNIAKEDAARKASMYHRVSGTSVGWQYVGSGYLDYDVGSASWLEYDEELEVYINKLTFDPDKDITRDSDGVTYIRFSYPANFPGNINYRSMETLDGSPEWTTRPPININGFIAGVGRSGKQERFADTVRRSYEAAVISIVSKLSTTMETTDTVLQNQTESQIRGQSSATLSNFLVLEIWVDPETGAVWTLAIARE